MLCIGLMHILEGMTKVLQQETEVNNWATLPKITTFPHHKYQVSDEFHDKRLSTTRTT